MSMEAAAGKNPVSHVGKLYNLRACRIAQEVVGEVDGIVLEVKAQVGEITRHHLASVGSLLREAITGSILLFWTPDGVVPVHELLNSLMHKWRKIGYVPR